MKRLKRPYRSALAVILLLSCLLLTAQSWAALPMARRIAAQRRWDARPFADYRISVRVEYWGNTCSQEIEAAGDRIRKIVYNDCSLSWLSVLTVARLFEVDEGLEHPLPCYNATQTCTCYRVKTGPILYDPQLGFPREIAYRRETYANLVHLEYWRRLWLTRRLPSCSTISPTVKITVISLKPIVTGNA